MNWIANAFLFKNNSFSTVNGLRWFLFFESISPALENTLSQGTKDVGVGLPGGTGLGIGLCCPVHQRVL